MIEIDGSLGEGGGQILRTSVALSILTRTPVRIVNIRAGREKPGLLAQHKTAIEAARAISQAAVEGLSLRSRAIEFTPGVCTPGTYHFDVGTAGSASLVLQTVLPPLMLESEPSVVTITGGTHNMKAPPFHFLERAFLPLLAAMGPRVSLELERFGFYPKGGGRIRALIAPGPMKLLEISATGPVTLSATAVVVKLDRSIAERELAVLDQRLTLKGTEIVEDRASDSPGNVVFVTIARSSVTDVATGFGEKGVPGFRVASGVADEVDRLVAAEVSVGEHLADQLILPMALAGGGRFLTVAPSLHTETNIEIVKRFLPVAIDANRVGDDRTEIVIRPRSAT